MIRSLTKTEFFELWTKFLQTKTEFFELWTKFLQKDLKINYPIVLRMSKCTRIDMSGFLQILWPSLCNTVLFQKI